jgi:hypothetical protein
MPLSFPEPNGTRELSRPHAQLFPVTADQIDTVALLLQSKAATPQKVRLGLREAPSVWDFRSETDIASVEATVAPGSDGWVEFPLKARVTPGKLYYVHVDAHEGIFWKCFRETRGEPCRLPVGCTAAYLPAKTSYAEKSGTFRQLFPDVTMKEIPGSGKEGHWQPLTGGLGLCMKLTPESLAYPGENVIRGTNRPDQWTNIWVSDPAGKLPATLELEWQGPVSFNTVQLTFDTDQNKRVTLPLFRYPDCVKDYTLEYHDGSGWKPLVQEQGNYTRRRVHRFDTVQARRLRLTVQATNGTDTARVYELRVYKDAVEKA